MLYFKVQGCIFYYDIQTFGEKMSKTSTVSRYLLGILYLGSAIAGILGKVPPPEPEAAQAFMMVLASSGLIYLVKIVELTSAIALLSGFFVPAALFLLAPVTCIILWFHLALDISGAPIGILLTTLWILTAFSYKDVFRTFLQPKPTT